MLTCARCGQQNPPGFRFCGACGAPLEPGARERREERKVVSVLFCDMVGSTGRAERMDPEDVRALLTRYHERVRRDLERFGGTVEKFIGDAVMALFGAPVAHEDDPERAVRAALAIRDWAGEGSDLQVRIGITSGEALIGLGSDPRAGEAMASGDVVNTAARLQSAAAVNGILVDQSTVRATERVIEYREAAAVEAKGKAQRVPVWEAVQARSRFGIDVRQVGSRPLVGRERERHVLIDALERVKHERSPQLLTLVGVPGIGKSRLVWELFRHVEQGPDLVTWRQGRSLPYGEGVAFWALGEIVKAQAGILETDSPSGAAPKLASAVQALIADDREASWVERHLRPLIGLESEDGLRTDRGEAFAAWRRFLEALADRRPLVLVFEDLHFADDALLDFVDHLVEWASGVPLLVVATARPELLARRPVWGGGKSNALTLSLSPLSDDETARLVHGLLERSVLDAPVQRSLLERAGGNPLYAEEFARLVVAGREPAELPETVHGIVAARLDLLSRDLKRVLQDASVVGKVFWRGTLAAMDGDGGAGLEQRLHALERQEFVRRERSPSVAGEAEYAFRHVLVRDVAYGQIPRAQRAEKHLQAAEWIESLGRREDHAEMLAHHYRQAIELARATGRDVGAAAERARVTLRDAGDRALALNAVAEAARSYSDALDLWPLDDPDRPRVMLAYGRARAHADGTGSDVLASAVDGLLAVGDREGAATAELVLGDLAWLRAHRDEAYSHLDRAVALLADAPVTPTKARVLSEVSRYHMLAGRNTEAMAVGNEALAVAEQLGLEEIQAHALDNIGSARANARDADGGIGDIRRAIDIAVRINSLESGRAYNNLGAVCAMLGDLRGASAAFHEGWRLGQKFGDAGPFAFLKAQRAVERYWMGDWAEALASAEEVIETGTPRYQLRQAHEVRARIRLARDDVTRAVEDAEMAVAIARDAQDPQAFQSSFGFAAFALFAAGRSRAAADIADELLALDPAGKHTGSTFAAMFDLAWVLPALDRVEPLLVRLRSVERPTRWDEAALAILTGDLVGAADRYAEMGALPNEAYTRLRAGDGLRAAGDHAAADAQLQRSLTFWRSVGGTRYIVEAEQLLAEGRAGAA